MNGGEASPPFAAAATRLDVVVAVVVVFTCCGVGLFDDELVDAVATAGTISFGGRVSSLFRATVANERLVLAAGVGPVPPPDG